MSCAHAGPTTEPDPREPFFPFQAARDGIVILAIVLALFWLAARHPAPLERLADPTNTSYVPRPEWYFLPLFQLLKFFKGPLEPIGTAILPGVSVLLLALVPWLDRGVSRRPGDRRLVLAAGGAGAALLLGLLYFGVLDTPKGSLSGLDPASQPPPDARLLGGLAAYERRGCTACHGIDGLPGADPAARTVALAARGQALTGDALTAHVKEKSVKAPATEEDGENPDKDIPSLLAYVDALGKDAPRFSALPQPIRTGGAAIDREDCRQCHQLYGEGGRRGPVLAHLLGKRDKDWLVAHFREPKKLVPGSKMPPFKFLPDAELQAMSDYLLALP